MQVSRAVCLELEFEVAIKQLSTIRCTAESSLEALIKDLHVSSKLDFHPCTMEVVDVLYGLNASHQDDAIVALVYRLHKRGSLYDHVNELRILGPGGTVELATALEIMLGMISGLRHMHECNMVHCDVKEANILISDDGQYIISDYGLSCETGAKSHIGCTFEYAAPEV
jgi:serine/threonine protein kinase